MRLPSSWLIRTVQWVLAVCRVASRNMLLDRLLPHTELVLDEAPGTISPSQLGGALDSKMPHSVRGELVDAIRPLTRTILGDSPIRGPSGCKSNDRSLMRNACTNLCGKPLGLNHLEAAREAPALFMIPD